MKKNIMSEGFLGLGPTKKKITRKFIETVKRKKV